MGLAERRAIAEFQEQHYGALKQSIDDAAGFAVDLQVDWDSLAVAEKSHLYASCFPKVYFTPLANALSAVGKDDLGKAALKAGLKQVVIKNAGKRSSPAGITFAEGTLTIDHLPLTNVDQIDGRSKQIVKLLESGL